MRREEFEAFEARVQARAERMWDERGQPEGGAELYADQARELVAIEEVHLPGLDPDEAAEPMVEEASIQGNLGEFPTLRDQGDEQVFPDHESGAEDDEDNIRLSDGDASETGGVLPDEDVALIDLPEVSVADADVTTDEYGEDEDADDTDLNDDGLVDQPLFDASADQAILVDDDNLDDEDADDLDEDDDDLDDEEDDEDDDEDEDELDGDDPEEQANVSALGRD